MLSQVFFLTFVFGLASSGDPVNLRNEDYPFVATIKLNEYNSKKCYGFYISPTIAISSQECIKEETDLSAELPNGTRIKADKVEYWKNKGSVGWCRITLKGHIEGMKAPCVFSWKHWVNFYQCFAFGFKNGLQGKMIGTLYSYWNRNYYTLYTHSKDFGDIDFASSGYPIACKDYYGQPKITGIIGFIEQSSWFSTFYAYALDIREAKGQPLLAGISNTCTSTIYPNFG